MKIEGPGSTRGPAGAKRAGRADGTLAGTFARALHGSDEAQEAGSAGAAPAVGGVGALLAAQEVEDSTSGPSRGKARARARAEALLDKLDEIRAGLLTGSLPAATLHEMQRLVQTQRDQIDDPKLAAVLDEIDLRAQVELAKLEAGR
ncbi:flagellar assembly protein FliX [Arenibaculum pallidiluteum]|uniref:flagellar assembly protein FliX n=1 Tax=Arenibaculum pallidiluteum TaxID=2812559 RepID=UPI001A96B850|nr:flagellar assembly protein FliX [Arenibaculum pallidiluteum]